MLTKPEHLIELDWPSFQPWRVTTVRHRLADHPLLQLDQLNQLAKRLEETGSIRSHSNLATAATSFHNAPSLHPNRASAKDTLEHLREAGAWLSLLNVQSDELYRGLVGQVLDDIHPVVEAKDPGMSYRSGFIFVTSPNTITPFHFDKEHNFILQILGRKTIYVWEPDDLEVASHLARDGFHYRHDRSLLIWDEKFRQRAHRVEVSAGDGAYMPSTSPHLVEVGDEPSITVSFTYYTNSTRRDSFLHALRGRFPNFGPKLPPVGHSPLLDQALYSVGSSVLEAVRLARILGGGIRMRPATTRYAHVLTLKHRIDALGPLKKIKSYGNGPLSKTEFNFLNASQLGSRILTAEAKIKSSIRVPIFRIKRNLKAALVNWPIRDQLVCQALHTLKKLGYTMKFAGDDEVTGILDRNDIIFIRERTAVNDDVLGQFFKCAQHIGKT